MQNPVAPESVKPRFAAVFSGGFITALALWAGVAKVFVRQNLLEQVTYTVGASAGAFAAVVVGTRNPKRVSQFIEYVSNLKSEQIFARRPLFRLGMSHMLLYLSKFLETWRNRAKKRERASFRLGKQTIVFAAIPTVVASLFLYFAGVATLGFSNLAFFAGMAFAAVVALSVLFTWVLRFGLWFARKTLVALLLARLQHFLQNPKLHSDAFNDPAFIQDTAHFFDAYEVARELAESPAAVEIVFSDMKAGVSRSWSSTDLKERWANVTARGEDELSFAEWRLAVQRFTIALFASASANVSFPPVRQNGDVLCDGALFRPNPLGPAFDAPADKILNFVIFEENPPNKDPKSIDEAIRFAFELEQRDRIAQEIKYAAEKTHSVKELRKLRKDMVKIVSAAVEESIAAIKRTLAGAVSEETIDSAVRTSGVRERFADAVHRRFDQNRFPFREDQPIDPVNVIFSPEPGVDNAMFGGPADFSAIPEVMERGYREALRRLHEEKII